MHFSLLDENGFFYGTHLHTEGEPIPTNAVDFRPPHEGEGKFFTGTGWRELELPEPTPEPEKASSYIPRRVSKIDFARLFRGTQEDQINKWEKICKSLTPEGYDDPENTLTLTVERVLKAFERPLEYIELNHPETSQALQLLAFVGVFGEDPVYAAQEVDRILSGTLPA